MRIYKYSYNMQIMLAILLIYCILKNLKAKKQNEYFFLAPNFNYYNK